MVKYALGVYPNTSSEVAPAINDQSFNITDAYVNGQSIGTVALANSPSPAPTYSITAGNDAGAIQINSSTGALTVLDEAELDHATTPSYALTVLVSNSAGSDSATVTVNVADALANVLITPFTITNPLNTTTTNQFVRIPLPMAANAVGSGQTLAIYDDNGSGGLGSLLGNFDIHAEASDMNGDLRFAVLNGIVPSLAASGTSHRKLYAYASSTAAPTGTALSLANLLDMDGMDNGGIVVNIVVGGTTYSADLKTMLTAGPGTFNKTGARCRIWKSGPCMTHFQGDMPVKNAGTAHVSGDGFRIYIEGKMWKATSGAYNSSTNPILGLDCWVRLEEGAVDRGTSVFNYAIDSWSIQRATSMTDATLITTSDTDPDGNSLVYTGSAETTWHGAAWRQRVHIGMKPAVWAFGDHLSTGAKTTTDNQHADYVKSTGLVANCARQYANVNHTSGINVLNDSGTSGFFPSVSTLSGISTMGEVYTYIPGPGPRNDIGEISGWDIEGLTKWDVNGRRRIFENAAAMLTYPYMSMRFYDTTTGLTPKGMWPRWDEALEYKSDYRQWGDVNVQYPGINGVAGSIVSPWTTDDFAHNAECGYVAYLMSGDLIWLELMHAEFAAIDFLTWQFGTGSGSNFTLAGPLNLGSDLHAPEGMQYGLQERAFAWSLRHVSMTGLVTPDTVDDSIVFPKSNVVALFENTATRMSSCAAAHTGDGPITTNLATSHRWAPEGPRYIGEANPDIAQFHSTYVLHALFNSHFRGMTNTNFQYCVDWYATVLNAVHLTSDVAYQYWLGEYNPFVYDGATPIKYWSDVYRVQALRFDYNEGRKVEWNTITTANYTLSANTGADVTVTVPSTSPRPAPFGAGSWYVGGFFRDAWPSPNSGAAVIDQVNSGNSIRIDISSAFTGTSLDAQNIGIPYPHPSDAETTRVYIPNDLQYYRYLATSAMAFAKEYGKATAAADYAAMLANWGAQGTSHDDYLPRAA
jgi:hypothetical protein